jgi:hypothetical protein
MKAPKYETRTVISADGTPIAITLCVAHYNPVGCTGCEPKEESTVK